MKKQIPAWLVLTIICVVAAALLAGTNLMTKDVIAANANREKMETFGKLMPAAVSFDELENGITVGKDGDGNAVGYALTATTQGFGGEIETTVAAQPDGAISGVSVGGSNFAETAGLGARAKEPEFQAQFAGKTAPVALTKDGGEIEALSGATITSRAVIKGVNEAMETIAAEAGFTVEVAINADHVGEGQYTSTAPGFGGPVRVTLTLDENRTITAMSIGDDSFAETPGLGARALEDDFQVQFIGKTIPVAAGEIEALSGATITTGAVLEAIGNISSGLDNGLAEMPIVELPAPAAEEAPAEAAAEEPAVEAAEAAEGTVYEATAQGFGGPVKVSLTLDDNGAITAIGIGDESFAETPGLGARAQEEEFKSQFIGKTVPVKLEEIDALAGATVTTTAVITAIQEIADSLNGNEAAEEAPAEEPAAEDAAEEAPVEVAAVEEPATEEAVTEEPAAEAAEAAEGTVYEATAQGFGGPVKVSLTLDDNGAITAIGIGDESFAETPGLGARALEEEFKSQFIGKTVPVKLEEIDALAGATVTTTAVITAIQEIADSLNGSEAAEEASAEEPAAETAAEEAAAEEPAAEAAAEEAPVEAAAVEEPATEEAVTEEPAEAAEAAEGTVYEATAQGFGGPVKVSLTLDDNGTITAIGIGDESFAETPGLGARAQEEEFKSQFIGKTVPVKLEEIDALAGATVTTTAVITAIQEIADNLNGSEAAEEAPAEEPAAEEPAAETAAEEAAAEEPAAEEAPVEAAAVEEPATEEAVTEEPAEAAEVAEGTVYEATAQGFGGPVKVSLTLDESGTITAIEIGDESFAETLGLGARVLEDAYKSQFIGKTVPVKPEEIDALAGSTVTTTAVITAIQEIADGLNGSEAAAAGTVYEATAQGFGGPVKVSLTLDESGTITAIEIGDESFAETPGLGARALEEEFKSQFIGKTVPVKPEEIDALAGATVTTTAVITAIQEIADQIQ